MLGRSESKIFKDFVFDIFLEIERFIDGIVYSLFIM